MSTINTASNTASNTVTTDAPKKSLLKTLTGLIACISVCLVVGAVGYKVYQANTSKMYSCELTSEYQSSPGSLVTTNAPVRLKAYANKFEYNFNGKWIKSVTLDKKVQGMQNLTNTVSGKSDAGFYFILGYTIDGTPKAAIGDIIKKTDTQIHDCKLIK
ncbi:hypothetical protein HN028_14200 [Pantoea ananatis]|uniref:hypothetical protein n=1 Tax=Pantoea ananas TaxID=553 RepID=UPI00352BC9BE